jgi:hypothetical protein
MRPRREGLVAGYVSRDDLKGGSCGDHLRPFGADDLVRDDASLQDVIQSLGVNRRCFVMVLDQAAAIVTLEDLEKPPVRMFLFGMITILEMVLVRQVEAAFPGNGWAVHVAPGRLAKAREVMAERQRRGLSCRLVECLQLSDEGQLALRIADLAAKLAPSMSGKEKNHPETSVPHPQPQASSAVGPEQHSDLLPKRQVLKRELPPRRRSDLIVPRMAQRSVRTLFDPTR